MNCFKSFLNDLSASTLSLLEHILHTAARMIYSKPKPHYITLQRASYYIRLNPNSLSQPRMLYVTCPIPTFLTSASATTVLIVHTASASLVFFPSLHQYQRSSALAITLPCSLTTASFTWPSFFSSFRSLLKYCLFREALDYHKVTLPHHPVLPSLYTINTDECYPLSLECKLLKFFEVKYHVQFFVFPITVCLACKNTNK